MDCEQLQSVQNLEYLPSEDELWIIDSGRINDEPVCRPKLVVWSVGRKEVGENNRAIYQQNWVTAAKEARATVATTTAIAAAETASKTTTISAAATKTTLAAPTIAAGTATAAT